MLFAEILADYRYHPHRSKTAGGNGEVSGRPAEHILRLAVRGSNGIEGYGTDH
jgi:hypothetical protein